MPAEPVCHPRAAKGSMTRTGRLALLLLTTMAGGACRRNLMTAKDGGVDVAGTTGTAGGSGATGSGGIGGGGRGGRGTGATAGATAGGAGGLGGSTAGGA